jgi:glycosyltransferase involved in cell wall biosynthesis
MSGMSVIIPCRDDVRIAQCLASIDDEVEVVISLNGHSAEVDKIVSDFAAAHRQTVILKSDVPNLAAALEVGSVNASGEVLLYMDSDCRFTPGTIRRFKLASESKEVVKGNIIFEAGYGVSRVIARSREHHTAEQITAYKPPLSVRAAIKDKIGGFFFDPRLIWREDSDLDYRIRQAQIPIHYEPEAVILHPPLSLQQDLRSAYRYGIGLARSRWYRIPLTEVPRSVLSTYRSKGFLPAFYMMLRNGIYNWGTLTESRRLRKGGAV